MYIFSSFLTFILSSRLYWKPALYKVDDRLAYSNKFDLPIYVFVPLELVDLWNTVFKIVLTPFVVVCHQCHSLVILHESTSWEPGAGV